MTTSTLQSIGAILLVSAVVAGARAASPRQGARVPLQPKPIKTTPPKDWPDANTAAKQKKDADNRALFASTTPLVFTLTANLKAVQADRTPNSTKTFPATIEFTRADGSATKVDLPIRTRGQVRRTYDVCEFAPLRLEFPKDQMKGTVFEGQQALKLGVHCRNVKEFEQYVLREYAAYRIYNLLTPRSFRARLAKVTYVDTGSKKHLGTKYGMLIEDDRDVAKRLEGRLITEKALLARLDLDANTLMALFEYMIGNNDLSITSEHNVKFVQMPSGTVFPVPYRFRLFRTRGHLVCAAAAGARHHHRARSGVLWALPHDAGARAVVREVPRIKAELAAIYDSFPDFDPAARRRRWRISTSSIKRSIGPQTSRRRSSITARSTHVAM